MEQYYIKKGRRYVEAGYSLPDVPDGFYFKQKTSYGSRQTSVSYWAGTNPPQPLDFQKLAAIMSNWSSRDLATCILRLLYEEFKRRE